VKIERDWRYKGYDCQVLMTPMGHRCGYVRVPPGHPWWLKDYDDPSTVAEQIEEREINYDRISLLGALAGVNREGPEPWLRTIEAQVEVHGGLTYAGELVDGQWWLGFDCAHAGDLRSPSVEAEYAARFGREPWGTEMGHYWTNREVIAEVLFLADQVFKATLRNVAMWGGRESDIENEPRRVAMRSHEQDEEREARSREMAKMAEQLMKEGVLDTAIPR
jgi:hypothetical protein